RSLPANMPLHEAIAKLRPALVALEKHGDQLRQPELTRHAFALIDELTDLAVPRALAPRTVTLIKMDGALGLSLLATKSGQDEIAIAGAFTRLGEELGINWLQGLAAQMSPSDPWERLLVAGSARQLQQMRLHFLAG